MAVTEMAKSVMDDLERLRREMAGLKREFATFRRQFKKLQVEFKERREAIYATWEQTDRLLWVHTRDMEEFHRSKVQRLARQHELPTGEIGKVDDALPALSAERRSLPATE